MVRDRGWLALGALYGLIAVAAAAGAAHLADGKLAIAKRVSATALASAVQMNGWHALALVLCSLLGGGAIVNAAATCFAVGVLLFCGSVYAGLLGLSLGPVTPVGGGILILGWFFMGLSAIRR